MTNDIPPVQTGAWLDNPGSLSALKIRHDLPISVPGDGEVLVKLECTGVCHSDVYNINGHTPMSTNIAGHEGVGVICKVGPGLSNEHLHKRVGIKWLFNYCNNCEICAVDITSCPNQQNAGRDVEGTFQQYCIAPFEPLSIIPDNLDSIAAAPLLCAGITMYSAIAKLNLKLGQWLVIQGAGGGLGHLGIQIAAQKGFKVIAVDTGNEKRELCMSLGAACFLDFKVDDVLASVKRSTNGYGAHGVICSSSSREGYDQALQALRDRGTLVCMGLAKVDLPISPFMMIVRGLRVIGSSVGTQREMDELMDMASRGQVRAIVKTYGFEQLPEVLHMLEQNKIAGRAVVRLPQ